MRKKQSIEKKIRLNALLIYIIVALLCGAMFVYSYTQQERISHQKQNIENNRITLDLTNDLITYINQAQLNANLYIVSKKQEYILQFTEDIQGVQQYIDSLNNHSDQIAQETILEKIKILLAEKVNTISDLNLQFDSYDMVDSLRKKLQNHELSLLNDAFDLTRQEQVTTVTTIQENDTVAKKGFFKRLAEVFTPTKTGKKKEKKITTEKETIVDTLSSPATVDSHIDAMPVLVELLNVAHKANKKYTKQITVIEKQMLALLTSDREISIQLSNLLVDLHQQTIDSTMAEIQKSEALIHRNYISSIAAALISLLLVLTLIIFIIKNANEGHKMRLAMAQANIRIQKTFESRHKLLLSISHDIKTPINSILGYCELWEHGHEISSKEVAAVQHSGEHILDLMESLLEFSALDQGLLKATSGNFNLYELCDDVVELFTPLASQKKLSFNVHFDFDKNLLLYSDALKVKQIVINILSNAIKYTVKGSVRFTVSYSNECIHFEVSDTGRGIPAQQLDTIFDAFTRVEENNSLASGSGFGLFVVKGMVDLLKGTVTIHSEVNKGTQVKVMIPAREISDSTVNAAPTFKRILAVDDDVVFLSILEKMLSELGHNPDTCHTLEICEKLSENIEDYDVVLTDADMVTFSGEDILQKMKKKGINIPVILMSGRSNLNHTKAIQSGFSGFLQKPVTMASLQQLLGGNERSSILSLEELFGDDKETIRKILKSFVEDTNKHIAILEKAVAEDDFTTAQKICHKMLPMFMQIKKEYAVAILKKINEMRGKSIEQYPLWKEDIHGLIEISKDLLNEINKGLL